MPAHQSRIVEVMVLEDGLITAVHILAGGQQLKVARFQNVLLSRGKFAAFTLTHPDSVKNCPPDVPHKMLSALSPSPHESQQTRPGRVVWILTIHWKGTTKVIPALAKPHHKRIANGFPG